MRVVNFFAGEGTWVRPWADRGHRIWRTDIEKFPGVDYTTDILNLRLRDIPPADVVLASPDCTAFSVASLGKHWGGGWRGYEPKTPKAHNRMGLVFQTVAFIEAMVARDDVKYGVIENPRGMLRKLQILDRYQRESVTYCRYGDTRMKPTDLWGVPAFPPGWTPRPMCKNGNPDHEAAPRGAKTGTQGLEKQARSHMPYELALEICLAAEKELGLGAGNFMPRLASPEGFVYYRSLVRPSRQHFLTPYTAEQIRQMDGRPYLVTGHGRSAAGLLLKNDGEIANAFSVDLASGTGRDLIEFAISQGGNRVEFFDHPKLLELYVQHFGFKVVERIPFSLELIREDFPLYDPFVSGTPEYLIARRDP